MRNKISRRCHHYFSFNMQEVFSCACLFRWLPLNLLRDIKQMSRWCTFCVCVWTVKWKEIPNVTIVFLRHLTKKINFYGKLNIKLVFLELIRSTNSLFVDFYQSLYVTEFALASSDKFTFLMKILWILCKSGWHFVFFTH